MSIGFPSVSNKVTDFGGPKVGGAVASEFASCMSGEVELTLDALDDCAGGQRATLAGEFLDAFDGPDGGTTFGIEEGVRRHNHGSGPCRLRR